MFYVAHRLFAAHDRALAAIVARILADTVGADNVFLPFCDTDEEDLVADVKGHRLFELDSERLKTLTGMLAILHGPSLDDGVCMEIGYAAALGVPIIALTTDFITYGSTPDQPGQTFPDPLIANLATWTVAAPTLGPAPAEPGSRFAAFGHRNLAQLTDAAHIAVQNLLEQPCPARTPEPSGPPTHQPAAFIEPSPYRPVEDAAELAAQLYELGFRTTTATRFTAHDPLGAAAADWRAATAADLLIADVSGPEAPPGAAAMIGAAAATGRRALAIQPVPAWTFAHGRESNWRNLMIQYAVDGVITTAADLKALVGT